MAQRLLEFYPQFMAVEPQVLKGAFPALSFASCEEAAQEAYLATGRRAAAGRLPQDTNLGAYLHTAARNRARSDFRRQARADRRLAVKGGDAPGATAAASVSGKDLLEDLVIPAIRAMKESRRRRVVELQSKGRTDAQIAAELGIPLSRLYSDRYEAVRFLRRILAGHIRAELGKNNQHGKKGD
ncbi:hypothetical protein OHU17_00105 [Streptomyces goshikiensis]|uniref:Uncharacterized protein n=1 Tax=Streptomyces goshikiensis TaxID=1942 RepID=A0ABZ1RC65_9ACTN|nr:hypothetical protein [Streptomyces goshikiensis]